MMESIPFVRLRMKSVIFVSAVIILGLICIIASLLSKSSFWSSLLDELAGVLLISGAASIIYEMFARTDFIRLNDENTRRILDTIHLSQQREKSGLIEVIDDATTYDYSELIEHSQTLIALLNDGRTWISMNSERFRKRFADPHKRTVLYLLHPDSPMLEILARKVGTSRPGLQRKLADTISMLNDLKTADTQLAVYGHYLFNPHSVLIGDEVACVSPYFVSRVRRSVPMFKFEKREIEGCYYEKLKDDLLALQLDATDISDFTLGG